MRLSTLCVGFIGSKSTRLLRHGMAGHMVEMVGLSWMAKPCGKCSRSLKVIEPPDLGSWQSAGEAAATTSAVRPTTRRNRGIFMSRRRGQVSQSYLKPPHVVDVRDEVQG